MDYNDIAASKLVTFQEMPPGQFPALSEPFRRKAQIAGYPVAVKVKGTDLRRAVRVVPRGFPQRIGAGGRLLRLVSVFRRPCGRSGSDLRRPGRSGSCEIRRGGDRTGPRRDPRKP